MEFFRQNKGRLQMCLPVDPDLCGNLEIQGKLKKILPDLEDGDERVDTCVDNFHSFCLKLLGGNYKWIHHTTGKLCGEKTFSLKHGINVVSYETVSVYKGQTDSILGTAFVSFLMLMLFLWGMLMITEFRAIYNFAFVVWKTPSTSNTDANFAKIEDSKMLVLQLPMAHKYFALFCIALPRFLIGLVILVVGTNFLTSTNNLLDLVLNSTVAWRNQPVRDFVGWGKNWMISDEHCTLFVSKSVPVSLLQAHYILGMSSQKFARAILPSCEGPSVKKNRKSIRSPSVHSASVHFFLCAANP